MTLEFKAEGRAENTDLESSVYIWYASQWDQISSFEGMKDQRGGWSQKQALELAKM